MLAPKLEKIIEQHLDSLAPAIALTVFHEGQCLFEAAFGWVDPVRSEYAMQSASLFDLASLTKLFTTTTFLALISAQKIPLDTPLVDILPAFGKLSPRAFDGGEDPFDKTPLPTAPHLVNKTTDPGNVTLKHLLTHTSGLPPWRAVYQVAAAPPPPDQELHPPREERWARALERLYAYPFVDYAGSRIYYSDIGLMLLGEVVSQLYGYTSGKLDAAIDGHIKNRLNLHHLMFNPIREHHFDRKQIVPTEMDSTWRQRRVWGEVHDENACGAGGVAGHAGLFSTAHDVAVFGLAWLNNPAEIFAIDPQIAEQAVQQQAVTEANRRGFGWMLKASKNSSAGDLLSLSSFGHTGFTGTSLWIDPDKKLVISLMTNRVYNGRHRPDMIHALRRKIHNLIVAEIA